MIERFKKAFVRKNGGSYYVKIPQKLIVTGDFEEGDVISFTYDTRKKVLEVVKA